ncbi:ribosomal protein S5 domain 2-type protein [Syncephalis fuscata]|nr:ribosomal protein S5 domain 2-type protein [Syncephalis fuscata]
MESCFAKPEGLVPTIDLDQALSEETVLLVSKRYKQLVQQFAELYGRPPQYIARAPGRVNLIGEHIDYAEFAVLPVALDRDILVACSSNSTHTSAGNTAMVNVASTQSSHYARETFDLRCFDTTGTQCAVDIDVKHHRWTNYVKCGIRGAIEDARATELHGIDILVEGTIPADAGLSSSSALVVASALATTAINNWTFTKSQLAITCARSEQYVGTNGGGMDQTCSLFAESDHALFIRFQPTLAAAPIPLPPQSAIVVFNSLVMSEKAMAADYQFNIRVLETRLAARILAHQLDLFSPSNSAADMNDIKNNHTLETFTLRGDAEALELLLNQVDAVFKQPTYTLEEVAVAAGITANAGAVKYLLVKIPVQVDKLKLHDRAYHVYSEAARVCRFREVCMKAAVHATTIQQQEEFKTYLRTIDTWYLMNQSQDSCRDLYECSCPELDRLTEICRNNGAYGARLTGAGWGGCCIALVSEENADQFSKNVSAAYYSNHDNLVDPNTAAFVCRAGAGARIYRL